MRLTRTLSAALVLALAAGIAACGNDEPADGGSDTATLPTVSGGFGDVPEIDVPDADPPTTLQVEVLSEGDGPEVAAGDLLVTHYLGMTWDGDEPFDASFDRGQPAAFSIGVGNVISGWDQALVGQNVGSRVLLVVPPDLGYGDNPPADSGIDAGDTLVFVVDILDSLAPDAAASGDVTPSEDADMPTVTTNAGQPTLTVPEGQAPDSLQVHAVVTGEGPVVQKGDLIVVQYVGKVWRNGKLFDSSWSRGSAVGFAIGTGNVIPGWDQALVGQTVGSRVLIVIPPDLAYGDNPPPGSGIQAGDTLVFAVDILGAY